jgi:heptosyltransferase-2
VKVLVRLPNWLGDTVMAVPALRSLRAGLDAEDRIAVAGPWGRALAGQGLFDESLHYPRSFRGRLRTADSIARWRPDVILVLPNSFEAALSAWYWGGRRRIGYDTEGRRLLLTHPVELPSPRRHQIDEYLDLLEPLGLPAVDRQPVLQLAEDEPGRSHVLELLAGFDGSPIVGIHLGAAFGPSKLWPPDRVAGLCAALEQMGVRPVLLGAPDDREHERCVREYLTSPVESLVGRDRPEMMPALLASIDALVSADTGAAHLAAAVGTPVVVLFGPTDPARSAPRGPATVIAKGVPCAPCFYPRCPIDHVCMRAIEVGEVRDAVARSLGRRARAARRPA